MLRKFVPVFDIESSAAETKNHTDMIEAFKCCSLRSHLLNLGSFLTPSLSPTPSNIVPNHHLSASLTMAIFISLLFISRTIKAF